MGGAGAPGPLPVGRQQYLGRQATKKAKGHDSDRGRLASEICSVGGRESACANDPNRSGGSVQGQQVVRQAEYSSFGSQNIPPFRLSQNLRLRDLLYTDLSICAIGQMANMQRM